MYGWVVWQCPAETISSATILLSLLYFWYVIRLSFLCSKRLCVIKSSISLSNSALFVLHPCSSMFTFISLFNKRYSLSLIKCDHSFWDFWKLFSLLFAGWAYRKPVKNSSSSVDSVMKTPLPTAERRETMRFSFPMWEFLFLDTNVC